MKNLILCGVGGQGTILFSKILSNGLVEYGYDVKMTEVHGMSQRGGGVSTEIRYGDKVNSPLVKKGEADIIIGFEQMETYRWLDYLKTDGTVIVNDYRIPSVPILIGDIDYPEGIMDDIKSKVNMVSVDALKEAQNLGNGKAMNIIMLGVTVKKLGLEKLDWEKYLTENIKPRFIDLNLKAFQVGLDLKR
jgi:indolepyruvate ferredoxin oxidoreductase beta subunit